MMLRLFDRAGWAVAGALAITTVLAVAGVVSGGPLDPSGSPGSTDGVREIGTPISSLPFVINQPGSYYLTRNLTGAAGQDGITVNAHNVTIDMNGFTLSGNGVGRYGIFVPAQQRSLVVHDGIVTSWAGGVQMALAIYSVVDSVISGQNALIGIAIGAHGEIRHCQAHGNQDGIYLYYSTARNCTVTDNQRYGIDLVGNALADGNKVRNNSTGIRVTGNYGTVSNNDLTENSVLDFLFSAGAQGVVVRDNTFSRLCSNSFQFLGTHADQEGTMYHKPEC